MFSSTGNTVPAPENDLKSDFFSGTFHSDTDGTFQSDTSGTFHSVEGGTFVSDTSGTFIPILSAQEHSDYINEDKEEG